MTLFEAARVLAGDVPHGTRGWVEVEGGRVVATGPGRRDGAVDLGAVALAPAYVDIQVNGFGPVDFATADADDCAALLATLRRESAITACCPTLCTAPLDAYAAMLERFSAFADDPAFLGVHLEGPFLGAAPGAHPVDLIRPVDLDWLRDLLDRFPGVVRIVTLAPEADPGCAATRLLVERGVVVAVGHSRATYDDVLAFVDAGATLVTHVFNGMGPLHHRDPGVPGAALADPRVTPSLIADFVHVHRAVVQIAIAARPDLVLVSDAVALGPHARLHDDGAVHLPDGTLAGSNLTMARAVENVVSLGVPVERAVAMASTNPAALVGATDLGVIAPGARADLLVLDPRTGAVVDRIAG